MALPEINAKKSRCIQKRTKKNNVLVILRTAVSLRTGAFFFLSFEPPGGFDPPTALTKALAGPITATS